MSTSSSSDVSASAMTEFPKDNPSFISRLPSDIVVEFIARLPLRSLIISSSVCKSWYALLENPYFVSKHFQHTNAQTYFLLQRRQLGPTYFCTVSLISSTESYDIPINIFNNIPFLQKSKLGLRISGSCNGLVCLSEERNASITILWNPITRVFKALPISSVKRPNRSPWHVIMGFGFDPVAIDFKLLRIVYYDDYHESEQVDIYSLSTNSWREIQPHQGFTIYQESGSMAVVNGRFHWKAYEIEGLGTGNVSKEVFTDIKLPNIFGIHREEVYELGWELVAWKEDFLCLIIYPAISRGRYCDMWVLDEYGVEKSWTKHFTFGQHIDVHIPLGCKSNCDSVTRIFKMVPVEYIPLCAAVFNYVGTLFPIEGGRTVEEANLVAVEPDPFFVR